MNSYMQEWLLTEVSTPFFQAYTGWMVKFPIAHVELDELWDLFNFYCGGMK